MKPIRKGSSPVKVPFQLRSTSKTLASWANEVRVGMKQLRDRIPQATSKRVGGGGAMPQLWVSLRKKKGSPPESPLYEAIVSPGYVEYQNANSESTEKGVTGWIAPTINGTKIDVQLDDPEAEIPALELSGMVNFIYLNVKTKADGDLKMGVTDCKIVVETGPKKSTHHIRPSPSSGENEGDYYFLLAETEEVPDSDPARPQVKRRITGNRFIPNQLIEIANLSGGDIIASKEYEVYKGYRDAEDKHELRVFKQVGTGAAVIRPIEGDAGSPENDQIKIRGLKEGGSPAQIKIEANDTDDDIKIRGNSYNKFATGGIREINVTDGLVTDVLALDDAGNLDLVIQGFITITQYPYIEAVTGDRNVLYWRNGVYMGSKAGIDMIEPPEVTNGQPRLTAEVAKIG